ncbi:MAG: hypothetical protein ORN98_11000 [Alphaproteobacteria bacterium]|nr:hypothetical protein [Alphaproteobacteria bacterium]
MRNSVQKLGIVAFLLCMGGVILSPPSLAIEANIKEKIVALGDNELKDPKVTTMMIKQVCGIKKLSNLIKFETCKTSIEQAVKAEIKSRRI